MGAWERWRRAAHFSRLQDERKASSQGSRERASAHSRCVRPPSGDIVTGPHPKDPRS